MKKQNSTLSKRLKQYSALAGSMLVVTGIAQGQVVYTDIPDDTLVGVPFPGDAYFLDLDNDGIVDYVIGSIVGSTYRVDFAVMYAGGSTDPNGIAGSVQPFGGSSFIGYPSALALFDNIDNNLNFFKFNNLSNPSGSIFFPAMLSAYVTSTGSAEFGNWLGGVSDHYLGFKFSPDGGAT